MRQHMNYRTALGALVVGLALVGSSAAFARSDVCKIYPDGTLTLHQAKEMAVRSWYARNGDGDGTLEASELRDAIPRVALALANPDGDGTLDKDEYMHLVVTLFRTADVERNRVLECEELSSPEGRALLRLLH